MPYDYGTNPPDTTTGGGTDAGGCIKYATYIIGGILVLGGIILALLGKGCDAIM